MKIVITKTICELINGDRKIINEHIVTADLEAIRKQIHKSTLNCRVVRFRYEELPD